MTSIPDNQFKGPVELNPLIGISSSRLLTLAQQRVEVSTTCQDSNNPSIVILEFYLVGLFSFNPEVLILEVDGDTSYESNRVTAPINRNDSRSAPIPIPPATSNGKLIVDFGAAIPNFLSAQKIKIRLNMVPEGVLPPGVNVVAETSSTEFTWEKGLLPTPYTISYEQGILKVFFQYLGTADCSCNIQCVTPSGVTSDLVFCPNDIQAISLPRDLDGDPFTFNVVLRDSIGNTSSIDVTTLINVDPATPVVTLQEPSDKIFRNQVTINRLNINNISVYDADYQIIRYVDTPSNYHIWKDWSSRGWDTFIDYDVKVGHKYGYAVRYKGKYGDISNFSPWAVVEAIDIDYSQLPGVGPGNISIIDSGESIDPFFRLANNLGNPLPQGFGEWTERFNHSGQETNAFAAYQSADFTGIVSLNTNQISATGKNWPHRFKATHSALIPKGRYRGHVLVWDTCLLIGSDPSVCSGELISFQPYAIINPNPSSNEPKFRNFLLPLGPSNNPAPNPFLQSGAATRTWSNLFCAGHTWTHNGDLLLVGGANVTDNFIQYAIDKTYIWNPAGTSTYSLVSQSGSTYYGTLTGGHYNDGAGCWVQGPDLDVYRYYPTATLSQRLSRVGTGDPVVYVFGGATPGWDTVYGTNNFIYGAGYSGKNSYEALQITGKPVGKECGYSKDQNPVGGSYVFNGPGYLGAENYFEDSLHFYPRMYVLSSGGVFMAGNAAKSATLKNHDTAPGVWTYTEGHDYRPRRLNAFGGYNQVAFYANAFGSKDYVVKMGGGTEFYNTLINENNITGWDISNVETITASITGSDWKKMPHLNRPRNVAQSVILADGSIFVFGGGQILVRDATNNSILPYPFRRPGAGTERVVGGTEPLSPWELLHGLHKGHDQKGDSSAIAEAYVTSAGQNYNLPLGQRFTPTTVQQNLSTSRISAGSNPLLDPEVQGVYQDFVAGGIILRYCFHLVPETIFPDRWESAPPQVNTPAQSLFQYHSTAMLLPDGRVFAGGGVGLDSTNRGSYNPNADYEIYTPHYLRPITAFSGLIPRRPQSVVIADATVNPNPEHNAYDLNYASNYTIRCSNSLLPDHVGRVVLVSPGAATHQADMSQRFFELPIVSRTGELTVRFTTPTDDRHWQKGFHMLFALSNNNTPSEAIWVKF